VVGQGEGGGGRVRGEKGWFKFVAYYFSNFKLLNKYSRIAFISREFI